MEIVVSFAFQRIGITQSIDIVLFFRFYIFLPHRIGNGDRVYVYGFPPIFLFSLIVQ